LRGIDTEASLEGLAVQRSRLLAELEALGDAEFSSDSENTCSQGSVIQRQQSQDTDEILDMSEIDSQSEDHDSEGNFFVVDCWPRA
jgi:hypothetical protein